MIFHIYVTIFLGAGFAWLILGAGHRDIGGLVALASANVFFAGALIISFLDTKFKAVKK